MSAAIAGPARIAASPTLPSKNFFIARPPRFPVRPVGVVIDWYTHLSASHCGWL
jgi:hypothetical protein